MKIPRSKTNSFQIPLSLLGLALFISPSAKAAHIYLLDTGGSNTFSSGGSYSGTGTVQAYKTDGTGVGQNPTTTNEGEWQPLVTGITTGSTNTITFTEIRHPQPSAAPGLTVTHSISLTGTGTTALVGRVQGGSHVNRTTSLGLNITDGSAITGITWVTTFSNPLHTVSLHGTDTKFQPWLGATRKTGASTGAADLTITYGGLATASQSPVGTGSIFEATNLEDSDIFFRRLTGGATIPSLSVSPGLDSITTGMISVNGGATVEDYTGIREVLYNSDAPYNTDFNADDDLTDGNISQEERILASSITFEWQAPSGSFSLGGNEAPEFVFSFDGLIGEDAFSAVAVPEPASSALLTLGVASLLIRRKRLS